MKIKILLTSVMATLVMSATLSAFNPCKPHYFRFGPEVYYRDYDEKGLPPPAKSHEFGWLGGFNIGYDYLKPCQLYFGSDVNYTWGDTTYDGSVINLLTNEITPYRNTTRNFFFDAEVRGGYTFAAGRSTMISPFIGVGYHFWHRGTAPNNPYGYDEDYEWGYYSGGVRMVHRLTRNFDIGLNLKAMRMFDGKMVSSDLHDVTFRLSNRWQYEVEIPLTYNFDCSTWFVDALRLTPYFRSREIGKSNTLFVDIDPIGIVSINEPSSTTYIGGARFELISNF